jgi:hypothetical protein
MKETDDASRFERLDILDGLLNPHIDDEFIDFIKTHDFGYTVIALGAIECGVTRPQNYDDVYCALVDRGNEIIDEFIDLKLKQQAQERVNRYVDSCPRPLADGGLKDTMTGEYIHPDEK